MTASILVVAASALLQAVLIGLGATWLRHKRTRAPRIDSGLPSVTLFKPLAGRDDELEANLSSVARLSYPKYEVLFGVSSVADPAYRVALAVMHRHPTLDAKIIITDPDAAPNPKVAQLLGLAPHAAGQVWVISDSNVRLSSSYLRDMVASLARKNVGLVTSLVCGTGEQSVGAAMENLQWGGFVTPLVALSDAACATPITVGKSMAFRRDDAIRLGLFDRIGSVLAEDFEMGRIFSSDKQRVATSFSPVENRNVRTSLSLTWRRHTRWMKMRRAIAPIPFLLEPALSPVVLATASLLLRPTLPNLFTWALAGVWQILVCFGSTRVLRGHWMSLRYAPVEVLRSYILFACWLTAWVSRTVEWRGRPYTIAQGSTIVPIDECEESCGLPHGAPAHVGLRSTSAPSSANKSLDELTLLEPSQATLRSIEGIGAIGDGRCVGMNAPRQGHAGVAS